LRISYSNGVVYTKFCKTLLIMEEVSSIIIVLIIGFFIGTFVSDNIIFKKTLKRHNEIIKEHNDSINGYDRLDLHYLTFGKKLKK